jgi:PKD repeat protein
MVVCEPTTLSITDPGSGYKMLWSTDETTTSITVDKTGTYWVSISNDCGSKTDAVRIIFDTIPTPEFIANWSGTFASFSNKSVNAVSYFWEFGDDSTSTDKHPTHRYKDLKEYTVKLTVKNSCDSSVTITKSIDLTKKPSGIQTMHDEAMIVYPNPANDFIVVKHSTAQNQKYTIELLTIDGRIVRSISNRLDANGEINVSVSDIAEGSYILRMIDKEGNQGLKKLAIVR